MANLPSDIIFDIFSRMPVKSLARFRCVSKQWCEYIDDPHLAIMHDKRATEEPTPVLFHHNPTRPNLPRLVNLRNIESKQMTTVMEAINDPDLGFEIESNEFIAPLCKLRGSCNGLLYLSDTHSHLFTNLSVFHPLRKECYELPRLHFPYLTIRVSCGFGFDAFRNSFTMVCVLLYWRKRVEPPLYFDQKNLRTMVHVLGTDSWQEVPKVPSCPITSEGVFADGCLHWLAAYWPADNDGRKVIWFDVSKEEFGVIDPPKKTRDRFACDYLVDLHGVVGLYYMYIDGRMEVWILNQKKWKIHCIVDVHGVVELSDRWNKEGDMVMRADHGSRSLIYNLKTGVSNKLNFVGWAKGCEGRIQTYTSSLFSIRGIINTNASSMKS